MFGFGNSDSASDSPVGDDAIQPVTDSLTALATTLESRQFAYDDRQQIATAITSLLATGHDLTDEMTTFEWVPPDANPSSAELAMEVRTLATKLTPATVAADTTAQDLHDLTDTVHSVHEAVQDAPEFPYAITEVAIEEENRQAVRSMGIPVDHPEDDPEPFAGPRARKQIETVPRENPDSAPLFVGTGTTKGRDASIPRSSLFEHSFVVGLTGTGKSTLLTNALKQVVEWGYGACYIDPKGDDSRRVMRILPERRLDDVVWVEPSGNDGYVSGFNFIDVGLPPDHSVYPVALTNLITDLVKLLGADDYWGPRMNRVSRNLIRAMDEYNRLSGDSEPDLTLVDLYYVLASRASREEFAARVSEAGMPFVQDYTQEIAEMPDDDLEPLLGRFLPWIQDDVVRRMISFRDGGVDIPKAIREGKIIIVRMGQENRELKRMLGMAIIRRIWAQIRARSEQQEREREPYFLIADEFDNLAVADETIPTMFSESRSYRLSITAGNQYPGQLPQQVVDGITTNTKSVLSFNPGDEKQARRYNNQLGVDTDTLTDEANYHLWMRVDDEKNYERSDAFRVYTHPPFPPYRTADKADELIVDRIKQDGREQPTAFEQQRELLFHNGGGKLETGVGAKIERALKNNAEPEYIQMLKHDLQAAVRADLPDHMTGASSIDSASDDTAEVDPDPDADTSPTTVLDDARDDQVPDDVEVDDYDGEASPSDDPAPDTDSPLTARERELVVESIFAARIQADLEAGTQEPSRWVPIADTKQELKARVDDGDTLGTSLSEIAQAYEVIGDDYAETGKVNGEAAARLTDKARTELFRQDTGSAGSGGSMKHRLVLRGVYTAFTALGYITSLPEQEGEEMPDGLAKSPLNPADESTMDAIEAARDELKQDYPAVWGFSKGQDVSVEAETSTQTYPHQTFRNLRKAIEKNHLCVYATQDGEQKHDDFAHWARRIAKVHYRASPNDDLQFGELTLTQEETADGNEVLYSAGKDYTVTVNGEERKAVRPTPVTVDDVPDNATSTKWLRDLDTGEYVMTYAVNRAIQGEAARFPDADAVATNGTAHAPAYYEYDRDDGEYVVYTSDGDKKHYGTKDQFEQNWEIFTAPFIPEVHFPREPTEDDFAIIIIPAEDSDKDQPYLYEHGDTTPLYDALGVSDTALTPTIEGDSKADTDAEVEGNADTGTDIGTDTAADTLEADVEENEGADTGAADADTDGDADHEHNTATEPPQPPEQAPESRTPDDSRDHSQETTDGGICPAHSEAEPRGVPDDQTATADQQPADSPTANTSSPAPEHDSQAADTLPTPTDDQEGDEAVDESSFIFGDPQPSSTPEDADAPPADPPTEAETETDLESPTDDPPEASVGPGIVSLAAERALRLGVHDPLGPVKHVAGYDPDTARQSDTTSSDQHDADETPDDPDDPDEADGDNSPVPERFIDEFE